MESKNSSPRHWGTKPGKETPDPIPVAIPLTAKRPRTFEQMFADFMSTKESKDVMEGYETMEEADDFTEDDPDTLHLSSRYELTELQEESQPYALSPTEPPSEAPQEKIEPPEGPSPQVQEETPLGASEQQ